MEVLYPRCAGLDVHQRFVVACLSVIEAEQRRKETRTFRCVTGFSAGLTSLACEMWAVLMWPSKVRACIGARCMIGWSARVQ